jgi:DNA polymerase-3 subunit epsilon
VQDAVNAQTRSAGTAAVLDVETTGFCPCREEILELAITLFRYDRVRGRVLRVIAEYSGLREPSCRIARVASDVHGITRRMVRGLDLDYHRIREMLRKAEFVIAHYARFDQGFVGRLIPSSRKKIWLCSRNGIDWRAKGLRDRSLDALAPAHEIENPNPHRAAGDVATLLALLSFQARNRKSYLYELLCNTSMISRPNGPL